MACTWIIYCKYVRLAELLFFLSLVVCSSGHSLHSPALFMLRRHCLPEHQNGAKMVCIFDAAAVVVVFAGGGDGA